jgi:hypothetical protein
LLGYPTIFCPPRETFGKIGTLFAAIGSARRRNANSPFLAALSHHAEARDTAMLKRVRAGVVAATSGKKVTWSNSSLLGEAYLAAR